MMADINYFIDCNSQLILINAEAPEGPRLTGEWGGDQCAGCGIDIIETGVVSAALTYVRCGHCGALYSVQQEERCHENL